jgi:hypothetical protein
VKMSIAQVQNRSNDDDSAAYSDSCATISREQRRGAEIVLEKKRLNRLN